jgi:hypothetical protein
LAGKGRIDMDVAGRAGAAATAQREQLVHAPVSNDFHDGQTIRSLENDFRAFPCDDFQLGHYSLR